MEQRLSRDLRNCPIFADDDADTWSMYGNMPTLDDGDTLLASAQGLEDDILPVTAWVTNEFERLGYFAMYYRDRARDLVRLSLKTRLGAENYFYVVGYLYRHAIELYMKSIIASAPSFHALADKEQSELVYGHDLSVLWDRVKPRIERLYDTPELQLVERLVLELHDLDEKSDGFRYPFVSVRKTGVREPLLQSVGQISYDNFAWVMESLCSWFATTEDARALRDETASANVVDRERLMKRWGEIIEVVSSELSDLIWQREQILAIKEMIDENPRLLRSPKPFLWDARRWYVSHALSAIRRQADKLEGAFSLHRVVREIVQYEACFTRETVARMFSGDGRYSYDPEFEKILIDGTWKDFATESGDFDVEAVKSDLMQLETLAKRVTSIANKPVTDKPRQRPTGENEPTLTFNDLDQCIDAFDRIAVKYIRLIQGAGMSGGTLKPTPQFDWYEEFSFAWKPQPEMEKIWNELAGPVADD